MTTAVPPRTAHRFDLAFSHSLEFGLSSAGHCPGPSLEGLGQGGVSPEAWGSSRAHVVDGRIRALTAVGLGAPCFYKVSRRIHDTASLRGQPGPLGWARPTGPFLSRWTHDGGCRDLHHICAVLLPCHRAKPNPRATAAAWPQASPRWRVDRSGRAPDGGREQPQGLQWTSRTHLCMSSRGTQLVLLVTTPASLRLPLLT